MAKKIKFPYKYLRPEQLEDLRRMKTDDLIKEHLSESRAVRNLEKQKKEDTTIQDLAASVKEHKESHDLVSDVKKLQEEIKELRDQINSEIEEDIKDLAALRKGWTDTIKASKERAAVILKLLEDRNK